MNDQTREVIRQRRAEIPAADRAIGWDYDYWVEDNCIYGAYFRPDGPVDDIEVLQVLEY